MKTYHNEHVTVVVEPHVHLLQQTWRGVPAREHYVDGQLAALQLAVQHQVKRWLVDQRDLVMYNPLDLQWAVGQWLPQAKAQLSRNTRVAIVLRDMNQFAKLGSDLLLRAALAASPLLESRYFLEAGAARAWLLARDARTRRVHGNA
ncbi:MAG: hypothetical protein AVDCRST_MAG56-6085 [uncultured Cytophagales bacterium]|uniref:STAS/SEC14 domain-containing protein n=1 Tax=uncultured Cytophagales bacterium TaxID=158755 RepID=A0A6J4KLZ1_9SPHI|nr:MAG: hypothetical protein AVDCRST_MAG56-6085 [uncultured Cytophagales bacterium]